MASRTGVSSDISVISSDRTVNIVSRTGVSSDISVISSDRTVNISGYTAKTPNISSESSGFFAVGDFYKTEITIQDSKGNILTEALYFLPKGGIGTVGEIIDGKTVFWGLAQTYTKFVVVASSDKEDVDYAWYESEKVSFNPANTENKTIQFNKKKITSRTGINTGFVGMS